MDSVTRKVQCFIIWGIFNGRKLVLQFSRGIVTPRTKALAWRRPEYSVKWRNAYDCIRWPRSGAFQTYYSLLTVRTPFWKCAKMLKQLLDHCVGHTSYLNCLLISWNFPFIGHMNNLRTTNRGLLVLIPCSSYMSRNTAYFYFTSFLSQKAPESQEEADLKFRASQRTLQVQVTLSTIYSSQSLILKRILHPRCYDSRSDKAWGS